MHHRSRAHGSQRASGCARWITLFALMLGLTPMGHSQDTGELPELGGREDEGAQKLIELFHQVERNLERIDSGLSDAGAGELPLQGLGSSGLEELLRDSQRQSQDVERAINQILEIANDMGQSQGSGSPSGQSPLDQPQGNTPKERERTPGAPEESGQKDEPSDGKDEKDQPNPEGGQNQDGQPPERAPGDPRQGGKDADEWGFLPDRMREVFRNQGRDDLPVRYRTWIDAYYRRLNRSNR